MQRRRSRAAGALLLTVAAAACTEPHACTLVLLQPSVYVDVGGLEVDPAAAEARLCLDDDCRELPVGVVLPEPSAGPGTSAPDIPPAVVWERSIPDRDEVRVDLVLTDRATGEEVYRGTGRAAPEVVEPNGPGCGESVVLPPLVAEPDGSLTP